MTIAGTDGDPPGVSWSSPERLRALTEQSLLCIFLINLEGRFLDANAPFLNLLGVPREKILSQDLLDLIAEEDRTSFLAFLQEIVSTGSQKHLLEYRLAREGGSTVSLETGGVLIFRDGLPFAVQIAGYDVSARTLRYESLIRSERKYRRMVENAHEGILVAQDGLVQYANAKALELIGSPDGAAAVPLFMDPEEQAMVFERCQDPGRHENLPYVYSFKIVDEDGRSRWIEIRAVTFPWEGRPATLNLLSDITLKKQSDAALRKSEEKYRLLVEHAHEAIFILQDGRVRFHNPNTEHLAGTCGEDLAAAPFSQWVVPEDWTQIQERMERESKGQPASDTLAFRVRKKNGDVLWTEANTVPVSWEENPALLCFVRDINEQKTLEAQLRQSQKMEAIGRLTGGVAHDFNNAMTVVIGFSDVLLLKLGKQHPLAGHLAEIKKAGNHAASLTRQLLAFSRKQVLHPQVLDPAEIIGGMEKMMRRLIGENIELTILPGPDPGRVQADPGQMEQVLLNLVINARDAMPRGGKITIDTRNVFLDEAYARGHVEVRPGPFVQIAVSDTGTGMDEATRSRIFEPFFTTKETGKGTGLGLATVYGIVKQSGGHIWVYSEPGCGTTFKIHLPRVEEAVSRPEQTPSAEAILPGSETVLVVEDETGIRQLICNLLKEKGYTVLDAPDPMEALRIGQGHSGRIHLALADVVMPGMSGKEMVERLASGRPDMKVLYMSGYTNDAVLQHGILEPGVHFLEKPFTPLALLQKVRHALDGRGQQAA